VFTATREGEAERHTLSAEVSSFDGGEGLGRRHDTVQSVRWKTIQ
jgi:hypothetical protein